MVATRQSLGGRGGTPESADDPRVQAVLRKLQIDGTGVLKGEAVKHTTNTTSLRTYRSKGANYLEVGNEPEAWLANRNRRRRRRTGSGEEDEAYSHASGPEVVYLSHRKRRNEQTSDGRHNLSHQTSTQHNDAYHSTHSAAECSHARVVHEAKEASRLRDLHDQRAVAASKGFQQFPFSTKILRNTLDRTIAYKLLTIARLNSKIDRNLKLLTARDFHPHVLIAALEQQSREDADGGQNSREDKSRANEVHPYQVGKTAVETDQSETLRATPDLTHDTMISAGPSPAPIDPPTPSPDTVLASCETSFVTADQDPKDFMTRYQDLDDFVEPQIQYPEEPYMHHGDVREIESDVETTSTVADPEESEPTLTLPARTDVSHDRHPDWTPDLSDFDQGGRAEEAIHRVRLDEESKSARLRRIQRELILLRKWEDLCGPSETAVPASFL